jgi:hypothetical protein
LILNVHLKNGEQQSGAIVTAKFNYLNDEHELRHDIEDNIAKAISLARRGRSYLRQLARSLALAR